MSARLSPAQRYLRTIAEKTFQALTIQRALDLGWAYQYHAVDSRFTTQSGFPDVVFGHPDWSVLLFVEFKRETGVPRPGKLSPIRHRGPVVWHPGQQEWHDFLVRCGMNAFIWRPRDLVEIEATLQGMPWGKTLDPERPNPRTAAPAWLDLAAASDFCDDWERSW